MRIAIAYHQDCGELRRVLTHVPGYQVAWVAGNGKDTIAACQRDKPDLLLMDLLLPGLDSTEVTRRIMLASPCPILLLANSVDTNVSKIFAAMGQGAKDVINFPESGDSDSARKSREVLLKKIRNLATLHHEPLAVLPPTKPVPRLAMIDKRQSPNLVVIGASTGGPGALAKLLSALPASLNAAIVVIQHVDQEFSFDLATWLNSLTSLEVRLAKAGEFLHPGYIYVASSNDHLVITAMLKFAYTPEPLHTHYRPSVDVFFESVARFWPHPHVAVLLTGMGRDGAAGLATLRRKGWHTIAQDQATSVVYGMPKAAKELDAAVEILPLSEIAPAILRSF
jgi:two-component system, chemotaxis family, response regulator WspF